SVSGAASPAASAPSPPARSPSSRRPSTKPGAAPCSGWSSTPRHSPATPWWACASTRTASARMPCWPSSWPTARRSSSRPADAKRGGPKAAPPRSSAPSLRPDGPVGLPELAQSVLRLRQPDERADDRQQDPQPGDARHRLLLPFRGVEVPDLGRHDERVHEADEDGEDQPDDTADAFPAVVLHLLERLVLPHQAVDAECDY